jgi:hypothetical protein
MNFGHAGKGQRRPLHQHVMIFTHYAGSPFNCISDSSAAYPQPPGQCSANQFHQNRIFLSSNGLVSILEEMPLAPVPEIKANRVPGKKPPHQTGQGLPTSTKKKMRMLRKQSPRTIRSFRFQEKDCQTLKRAPVTPRSQRYLPSLCPADHDVA